MVCYRLSTSISAPLLKLNLLASSTYTPPPPPPKIIINRVRALQACACLILPICYSVQIQMVLWKQCQLQWSGVLVKHQRTALVVFETTSNIKGLIRAVLHNNIISPPH
jgi:hypothetical protein